MRNFLNAFLIFIIATLLHWVFIEIFAPFNITLGIMLAFALIMAARSPRAGGYTFAFFCGLFLDFFSASMFGGYALAFTLLMFTFYHVEHKIDFKEPGPQLIITAGLNMYTVLLYGLLGKIFTGAFLWHGFASFVAGSLITGLLAPVLYVFVNKYLIFGGAKKNNESATVF